jgi:hypothetical protein
VTPSSPTAAATANRPNARNQLTSLSLATSWAAKPASKTGTVKAATVAATAPGTAAAVIANENRENQNRPRRRVRQADPRSKLSRGEPSGIRHGRPLDERQRRLSAAEGKRADDEKP